MKILVTGGFGFLGGHLIERLLSERDNQVHVVDNLSTNPIPMDILLEELGHPSNLTYSIQDVGTYVKSSVQEQYDAIYHLASIVGPAGVLSHNGYIAASIVNDTMAIIDLALKCNARLIDVSTSEVYGGGQNGFCSEEMFKVITTKVSARLEYAVGKLAAETALLNLCQTKGLDATIVRPFNITGPRQSGQGGFVLPRFIGQSLTNMDITVFGDGAQIRAFTHVEDMVAGILLTMKKGKTGAVYNLGNPENRCSILELAEDVKAITGTGSKIKFVDPKKIYGPLYEEANDKFPDAKKAFNELGWRPRFDRKMAIKDTFEYMSRVPERLLKQLRGF